MVFNNNLLLGAAGQGGSYEIENSLRLDGTGDMSRTVSSDGNLRTWTFSFWLKRSTFGTNGGLGFNVGGTYVNASNRSIFRFHSTISGGDDDWYWAERSGGAWREDQATTIMYRDPSAWSHYMCVWDTDGGTTPRARRYVNGESVDNYLKSGGTAAAANVDSGTNQAGTFQLFDQAGFPGREFEGYCAEMHFVDGTALGPSSFGETNDDGVWIPIEYTGTYGSNGFYLDFADSSDLGKDVSGNGNNFTSSGLATTDQMLDTPTNNHCTFNPLWIDTYTLSDGNLVTSTGADAAALGTMAVDATDSNGWYWEMKVTTAATYPGVGIVLASQTSQIGAATSLSSIETNRYYYEGWSGNLNNQGSTSAYGSTWSGTANKVIGVYLKGGALWFSIDGVVQNSGDPSTASTGAAITGLTGDFYPVVLYPAGSGTQAAWTAQFAKADWGTTPPTGYKALNTANLPTPSITDGSAYFQPTLYTGTGSSRSVDQSGNSTFQPDWVWIKARNAGYDHALYDAVRGVTKELKSNDSGAEATIATGLTAFESDGFQVGSRIGVNGSSDSFVAWQWKANGAGSSNTDGDITSTVSANPTSGVSVLTYSGNGSDNQTIGHGLGIAPKMIITKRRDASGNWTTYHDAVGINQVFYLDLTNAPTSNTEQYRAVPTSSVYTVGVGGDINNASGTYVAYVFAEVEGFSKIGSYTGNGSTDGTFVYTGFKPAYVILKRTNAAQEWQTYDTQRDPFNVSNHKLEPNSNSVESVLTTDNNLDFLSNGFKLRQANGGMNASGSTYIYMAFAENPFGGDGAAPATAR